MTTKPGAFAPGSRVPLRLTQRLEALRERKMAVLTAPAGSGKTALARAWIESDPALSDDLVELPSEEPESALEHLHDALRNPHDDRLVTVLCDSYNILSEDPWLSAIWQVVERDPATRLIVAGRARPNLRIADLARQGGLISIGARDLALTADEQREILARCTPAISDAVLERIAVDYDGWAFALELLANDEVNEIALTSAAAIVDSYVREEILADVDAEDLELLESISEVPAVTPAAAETLSGMPDAGARLSRLVESGLPLEWAGDRIRMSPPLRRHLAQRLRSAPGRATFVHRRTARWLDQDGHTTEAIRIALESGQAALAEEMITRYAVETFQDPTREAHEFLTQLIPQIPTEFGRQLVAVSLLAAEHPETQPVEAIAGLERMLDADSTPGRRARFYAAALLASRTANYQRRTDVVQRAVEFAEQHRGGAAAEEIGQLEHGLLMLEYGIYCLCNGDRRRAEDTLQRAIYQGRMLANPWLATAGMASLGLVHALAGQTEAATRLARTVVASAHETASMTTTFAGAAHLALSAVAVAQGRLDEAEAELAANERFRDFRYSGGYPFAAALAAEIALARNDPRRALRELQTYSQSNPPQTADQRARIASLYCETYLALGDFGEAERHLAIVEASPVPHPARAAVLRIRLLLSQGKATAAYDIASRTLARTDTPRDSDWLDLMMAYAVTCSATGRQEEALEAFQKASTLAQSMGLDSDGARHAALLAELRPRQLNLTEAEERVLAELTSDATAAQIAQRLFISPNTLKTHMRRIYRKLGVSSRSEAVAHAQALGLRPSASSTEQP